MLLFSVVIFVLFRSKFQFEECHYFFVGSFHTHARRLPLYGALMQSDSYIRCVTFKGRIGVTKTVTVTFGPIMNLYIFLAKLQHIAEVALKT
ncbi:hypothetical protein DN490_11310 [Burkholderia multivorans]|nr:hypothetical protein DN490_11310 [Burkholderia multivorans]